MNSFIQFCASSSASATVGPFIRTILAFFCKEIYWILAHICEIFLEIAEIPSTIIDATKIYGRITMLLTVIMVFYVTFEFVKYIVEPKNLADEEKGAGNLLKKMVIVIILIAFVPTIFDYAMQFQSDVVSDGIIFRLFGLNYGNDGSDIKNFGYSFSSEILQCFYETYPGLEDSKGDDGLTAKTIVDANIASLESNGNVPLLTLGLDIVGNDSSSASGETYAITFNGVFALVFGAVTLYMILLYCFDLGTRYAKLMFLEIVAPVPIIGYLSEKKDNTFSKWVHQCIATYIDVFIRLAIFGLVLVLSQNVMDAYDNAGSVLSQSNNAFLVKIFIISGLLLFMKSAPKLIEELFPSMGKAAGNFGFSLKDRGLDKGFALAKRTAGMAAGAAVGAGVGVASGIFQGARRSKSLDKNGNKRGAWAGVGSAVWGAARGATFGAVRGAANGVKKGNTLKNVGTGVTKELTAQKNFGNRQENGYSLTEQVGDTAKKMLGGKSRIETHEENKAPLERKKTAYDKVKKLNDDMRSRAETKIREGKDGLGGRLKRIEQEIEEYDKNPEVKARYSVSKYKTNAEANAAYNKALQSAKASVNLQNFRKDGSLDYDMAAYNKAVAVAQAAVSKDEFKVGPYLTQAAADAAFEAEGQRLLAEKKKILDDEINAFINNGTDDGIKSMKTQALAELEEYNKSASSDNKVDIAELLSKLTDADTFDSYVKKEVKKQQDETAIKVMQENEAIERIKRETSGSGIAGDKK